MHTHTQTHIHRELYIENALITGSNKHQKLTCRCFLGINVPLLHSESSWEIKLLLVDGIFFIFFFSCFVFIRMSFSISLSLQVCWVSLTPTAGSPKTITSTLQEGSSQGAQGIDASALLTSTNKQTKKIDQGAIDF